MSIRYQVIVMIIFFLFFYFLVFKQLFIMDKSLQTSLVPRPSIHLQEEKKFWKNINPLSSYSHFTSCIWNLKCLVGSGCHARRPWSSCSQSPLQLQVKFQNMLAGVGRHARWLPTNSKHNIVDTIPAITSQGIDIFPKFFFLRVGECLVYVLNMFTEFNSQ